MASVIFAWDNYIDADGVFITNETEITTLPAENLKNPHIAKKWRSEISEGEDIDIFIELVAASPVRVIALIGHNIRAQDSVNIKIMASNTEPLVEPDILFDSGVMPVNGDERYGVFAHVLDEDISAQFWLIKIYAGNSDLPHIQAGRLVMAPIWQPQFNFSYGWDKGYSDLSRVSRSRGGQQFVDRADTYRCANIQLDFLSENEADEYVMELDRMAGLHSDVLMILNPDAPNRGQNTIWGLIKQQSNISEASFKVFSKNYSIEERL